VCLAFMSTYKKLYPLKLLKEKVTHLGEENFDIEFPKSDKNDEVSALAREFHKSATSLKEIKEARNVFIRNIMHELKTPITKGKFLMQLPHDEANDEKMKNVFNRLEALINEFSSIEELISSSKRLEKSYFYLNDIVDNAVDILMLEENEVKLEFENIKLFVNFKIFTLAVKNLIDNAIKYSPNKQVTIKTDENGTVFFENQGEPLKYELHNYFEPFFTNEQKNKESFGLGLYIVNAILNASDYSLQYEHKNGINQFKIVKKEKS
jgi:two-component system OmpR family sensor kinase